MDEAYESPETELFIGCAGLPARRPVYATNLSAVELREAFTQPPGAKAAQRWRQELGRCAIALPAWQLVTGEPQGAAWRGLTRPIAPADAIRYGLFRDTDEVRAAYAETAALAELLDARAIVFNCPASFTPTTEHKARLRRFFAGVPRDDRALVLSVRGVWEASDLVALCGELELVPAVDPLQEDSPELTGPLAYFQLPGPVTGRYRYDDGDFEDLRAACEGLQRAFCIFTGPAMWDDARVFQKRVRRG